MDLKKTFATDKQKETGGVWVSLGEGAEVLVARATNPKYRAALAKFQKQFCGMKPDPQSSEFEKAVTYAMAEAVLLDWKGIAVGGENLEYSFDNAVSVLMDYPDFREAISRISLDVDYYRPDEIVKK
jgi:hypothetical protein